MLQHLRKQDLTVPVMREVKLRALMRGESDPNVIVLLVERLEEEWDRVEKKDESVEKLQGEISALEDEKEKIRDLLLKLIDTVLERVMNCDTRLVGMGRDEMIAEVLRLAGDNDRIRRERDAYLENLTRVQERCTELLLEVRTLRRERDGT